MALGTCLVSYKGGRRVYSRVGVRRPVVPTGYPFLALASAPAMMAMVGQVPPYHYCVRVLLPFPVGMPVHCPC